MCILYFMHVYICIYICMYTYTQSLECIRRASVQIQRQGHARTYASYTFSNVSSLVILYSKSSSKLTFQKFYLLCVACGVLEVYMHTCICICMDTHTHTHTRINPYISGYEAYSDGIYIFKTNLNKFFWQHGKQLTLAANTNRYQLPGMSARSHPMQSLCLRAGPVYRDVYLHTV